MKPKITNSHAAMGTDSVLISKQKGRKIEHFNN